MSFPSTESKPLRERLLPQTSIRFFLALIGLSALVMVTFRAAFISGQMWAQIVSLLVVTIIGSFLAYAVLFFLANLFTATTAPLVRSSQPSASSSTHRPEDSQVPPGDA